MGYGLKASNRRNNIKAKIANLESKGINKRLRSIPLTSSMTTTGGSFLWKIFSALPDIKKPKKNKSKVINVQLNLLPLII